jgi:hypothetical protein
MKKHGCCSVLFIIALLYQPAVHAGFTLDLSIQDRGSVRVIANGSSTEYNTNSSVPITGDQAMLVGVPKSSVIDGVAATNITLSYGQDLTLDLVAELGSTFVNWTGTAIPSINPDDPLDVQDETDNNYTIYSETDGEVKQVEANFAFDIGETGIDQVRFRFNYGGSWIDASEWNFTGDDDPLLPPSPNGNILINMNWNDLLAHIDLNTTNRVDLLITDNSGRNFFDAFDLDVNSSAAVPEPASWGLVSVAALGALGWRRRSRMKCVG